VVRAAEKDAAAATLALDDRPAVLGAGDARLLELDVLAGGVVRAGRVLAEPAVLDREVLAALRAGLVERDIRLRLDLPLGADGDPARGLALGIGGAGQEGTEPAALEDHVAAPLGTALLRELGRRARGPVLGLAVLAVALARDLLGVLALGIARAGEELAEATPLLDHPLAALLADEVGRDLLALHVAHVLLRVLEVLLELAVELLEGLHPAQLPL